MCVIVCMYVCMYVILFLFLPEGKLLDISLPDQTVKRQNGEVYMECMSCMYVYIHVCMLCMYVRTVCMYVYLCMYTCIHVYVNKNSGLSEYACLYCMYTCICMYVCMYCTPCNIQNTVCR